MTGKSQYSTDANKCLSKNVGMHTGAHTASGGMGGCAGSSIQTCFITRNHFGTRIDTVNKLKQVKAR